MQKIYNEFGMSLVLGKGNWIGFSYELEDGDYEKRGLGWKKIDKISDVYIRTWVFKKVISYGYKNGFAVKAKNKYALKIIFGFSN
nr:hypothetical protein [Candidatus Gracilibacteria bacterium]